MQRVCTRKDGVHKMTRLEIALLGAPTVSLDGKLVSINRNKSMALLGYLALADGAVRRDSLATLFWPEIDQNHARANLRRELAYLRTVLGTEWLTADREEIVLDPNAEIHVDVLTFRVLLTQIQTIDWADESPPEEQAIAWLTEATGLYRGDFLEGFSLRDTPGFDDWQYYALEELRRKFAWALDLLLQVQRRTGNLELAQELALRRLAIDPLDEAVHAQLIQIYLEAGKRNTALRQYNHCAAMLERELGIPPSPALQALRDVIHAGPSDSTPALPIPQQDEPPDAEIHTVVALSLSVLPERAARSIDELARTAQHVDDFLAACRERLCAAAARIVYASSESVLAVFGAPTAHEDDAQRCLRSAFDLRSAAEQLDLAVATGVAAGQAYIRSDSDRSSAETVLGPVLNLAADLQRAAGRSEVIVDGATYLLTYGQVDYSEAVHIPLRGRLADARRARSLLSQGNETTGLPA